MYNTLNSRVDCSAYYQTTKEKNMKNTIKTLTIFSVLASTSALAANNSSMEYLEKLYQIDCLKCNSVEIEQEDLDTFKKTDGSGADYRLGRKILTIQNPQIKTSLINFDEPGFKVDAINLKKSIDLLYTNALKENLTGSILSVKCGHAKHATSLAFIKGNDNKIYAIYNNNFTDMAHSINLSKLQKDYLNADFGTNGNDAYEILSEYLNGYGVELIDANVRIPNGHGDCVFVSTKTLEVLRSLQGKRITKATVQAELNKLKTSSGDVFKKEYEQDLINLKNNPEALKEINKNLKHFDKKAYNTYLQIRSRLIRNNSITPDDLQWIKDNKELWIDFFKNYTKRRKLGTELIALENGVDHGQNKKKDELYINLLELMLQREEARLKGDDKKVEELSNKIEQVSKAHGAVPYTTNYKSLEELLKNHANRRDITIEKTEDHNATKNAEATLQNLQIISDNLARVSGELGDRLTSLNSFAAGDEMVINYGAWAKGTFGTSSSKVKSGTAKSTNIGFTVGADAAFNEDITLGLAYSYAADKSKLGQTKTDIVSNIGSIYGSKKLTNELLLNGNVSFGLSNITSKNSTLNTKFKSKAKLFAANIGASYDAMIADAIYVTPSLDLSYAQVNINGSKLQNGTKLKSSGVKKLSITPALTVKNVIKSDSITFIPEAKIAYSHAIVNKGKAIKINDSLGNNIISAKYKNKNKGLFKAGVGATIIADNIELSAGYEAAIANKYNSHTGSVKVRINF